MYHDIRQLFEPLSLTDAPEVENRRFENLHTQAGAHLDTYTDVETSRITQITGVMINSTVSCEKNASLQGISGER